jgi:hypothetical protein
MTISNHDHPMHNLLRADVVRGAGPSLDQGALALAMWFVDSVSGGISAHVRICRDEEGEAVALQGLGLYYHQVGAGPSTYWTREGYFITANDALDSIDIQFNADSDLIVTVDARNIAAFLREVNLPPIDTKLFVSIVKLGKPARRNASEVIERLRSTSGAPVDVCCQPFTNEQFLSRLLEGAGTPALREQLLREAANRIHLVKAAISLDRADLLGEMLDRGCAVDMVDKSNRGGSHLIHLAAGAPNTTRLLLERGASVHCTDAVGATPLHKARDADVVSALVAHGARLDAQDNGGEVPLHCALRLSALAGHDTGRLVEPLLLAGADPFHIPTNATSSYLTPFQTAVKNGWVEQASLIADRFPVDFAQRTVGGRTLAQLASKAPAMRDFLKAAKTSLVIKNSVEDSNDVSPCSAGEARAGFGREVGAI